MAIKRRVRIFAALVLIFLLLPVLLLAAADHGVLDEALRKLASASFGRDVQFSRLKVHLLAGAPTINVQNLSVSSPPEITEQLLFRASSVTAHFSLISVLEGHFVRWSDRRGANDQGTSV